MALCSCCSWASHGSGFSSGARALENRLSSCGTWVLWYVESSRTRDRTRVSNTGKWILYHWATREALHCHFSMHCSPVDSQHHICRNCLRIYILFASNSKTLSQFSHSVVSESLWPWTAALQASLSITNSWSLFKLMSIESMMPSNHLILCRPLLPLSSIFPSIRVFSNESVLHIKWLKYWSLSFSISPSLLISSL